MTSLTFFRQALARMPAGTLLPRDQLLEMLDETVGDEAAGGSERLLTLDEVAELVGRAVSTVRTWCNSGQLAGAFRLNGRDWRIPESALHRYLQAQGEDQADDSSRPSRRPADLGRWRQHRRTRRDP